VLYAGIQLSTKDARRNIFILALYVLIDAIYIFCCFLSVYTQYLWPISPMQCFYGPDSADGERQHGLY